MASQKRARVSLWLDVDTGGSRFSFLFAQGVPDRALSDRASIEGDCIVTGLSLLEFKEKYIVTRCQLSSFQGEMYRHWSSFERCLRKFRKLILEVSFS